MTSPTGIMSRAKLSRHGKGGGMEGTGNEEKSKARKTCLRERRKGETSKGRITG